MKYTTVCKECDKSFTHPTQTKADQALRFHVLRKHPKASGKRPYVRKKKSVEVSVNFCPNCGCNLHAVALGLAMSRK